MYRYEDLADAGVFNLTTPTESKLEKPFYTEQIYRDKQGHYRLVIPVEACASAEDMIGVWAETVPNTKFIRRTLQIFPPHEVVHLTPEEKYKMNLRKVYPNFSTTDHRFICYLPMGKIKTPVNPGQSSRRWGWTHIRLHVTENPNKYWMEFLDLRRPEPEENQVEKVREDKIFKAYDPNQTKIRWD